MSTFPGRIHELPGVMIDLFEDDLSIRAFFVSHDHSDHTRGISNPEVQAFIESKKIPIYVSPLCAQMLRNRPKLSRIHEFITPISLDSPKRLHMEDSKKTKAYTLIVTLTSAEHIMGSVMFLFERAVSHVIEYRCLYTGDFRLSGGQLRDKRCLRTGQRVKPFDAVYFDSTWCTPRNHWTIPTREEVVEELFPLIQEHLDADEQNIMCIYTFYNIGYENLLREMSSTFKSKIHVTKDRLQLYQGFSGMEEILTTESGCRIHFCQKCGPSQNKSCDIVRKSYNTERVLKMKCSYKWFIDEHHRAQETSTYVKIDDSINLYNVCWSTHPSLKETLDLLDYLNPDKAFANVLDKEFSENDILDKLRSGSKIKRNWHPLRPPRKFEEYKPKDLKQKKSKGSNEQKLQQLKGRDAPDSSDSSDSSEVSLFEKIKKSSPSKHASKAPRLG